MASTTARNEANGCDEGNSGNEVWKTREERAAEILMRMHRENIMRPPQTLPSSERTHQDNSDKTAPNHLAIPSEILALHAKQHREDIEEWRRLQAAAELSKKKQHPGLDTSFPNLSRDSREATWHLIGKRRPAIGLENVRTIGVSGQLLAEVIGKPSRAEIDAAAALLELSKGSTLLESTVSGLLVAGLRQVPWVDRAEMWAVPRKYLAEFEHFKANPSKLPLPLCSQPDVIYRPPPPPPIPRFGTRRPAGSFSLLNCIMSNPEILLSFIARLSPSSLVSLYAISKSFHYLFNCHYVTYIMANARYWAGTRALKTMPWLGYRRFSIYDPTRRDLETENDAMAKWGIENWQKVKKKYAEEESKAARLVAEQKQSGVAGNENQDKEIIDSGDAITVDDEPAAKANNSHASPANTSHSQALVQPRPLEFKKCRIMPSLRYLQMLISRQENALRILSSLFLSGHTFILKDSRIVLMKICFLMNIKNNANRIGLIHNQNYFTTNDLVLATCIMIKIDMMLSDGGPVHNTRREARNTRGATRTLRKVLFGQKSLKPLADCLVGRDVTKSFMTSTVHQPIATQIDAWRLLVHNSIRLLRAPVHSCLDLAPHEIGSGCREAGSLACDVLLRPDQLVVKELVYRRVRASWVHLNDLLAGFVYPGTLDTPILVSRKKIEIPRSVGEGTVVAYAALTKEEILMKKAKSRNESERPGGNGDSASAT